MAAKSIISHPVEVSLRLIGVWPDSSWRILKNIIWATTMSTFLVFQYWYCIAHVKTEALADLLDCLSLAFSNTLLFMKFIIIWFHNRQFSETLLIMAEDWDNCKSKCNMQIMLQKAGLSYRIARFMLVIFACSILLYTIAIFFSPDDSVATSNPNGKRFLLRMEFPFEATVSPVYEIIVTVQLVAQSIFSLMAGMSMALITTFVLHLVSQIDVVCDRLTEILGQNNKQGLRALSMKTIIAKHQRIINLSDNIENVFTFISLLQFFFNIVVMCFVSFILVTSLHTDQRITTIIQCLPYYIVINFEALALCYTGEYLSLKSESIGSIAYNSNWYELTIQENRALLLLILRSQKPLTLTIGKFMNLSLETFANMLKASASYASVLYAMDRRTTNNPWS